MSREITELAEAETPGDRLSWILEQQPPLPSPLLKAAGKRKPPSPWTTRILGEKGVVEGLQGGKGRAPHPGGGNSRTSLAEQRPPAELQDSCPPHRKWLGRSAGRMRSLPAQFGGKGEAGAEVEKSML